MSKISMLSWKNGVSDPVAASSIMWLTYWKGDKFNSKMVHLITARYHPTPVRMVAIKQVMTSVGMDKDKGNPHALLVQMYTGAATVETVWKVLKKLKVDPPYDPAAPLLDVYFDGNEITILK